ncbi:bifunctional alpha/beta hydrolase/OsmC family protein [Maritalea porphyrae]|uniref:bifunctional alpha/beta hydrolase/OsmC family protein n=1 Tax=Maritalea porphyrae TaxID=880732 RepID=UPI0022AF52F0|nr:bifunctional alpha/beta hydrolase/OsmC family protein [Maritalea porphyrae]MCZ4271135.1 bifunctional alpha/beta hydrolase/OsmC family protein [Maritalea porphyrae]
MEKNTKVEFDSAMGEQLAAAISWPRGKTRAFAIFAHCFSCSKDFVASRRVANALTEHGFAVLRIDFTGLGKSGGDFSDTNFSTNVQDLVAAANWLTDNYDAPALLVGHSLGGAAVLAAAPELASVKAVATIGAPANAVHVLQQFSCSVEEIEQNGEGEIDLGGRPFVVKKQFLDDVRTFDLPAQIKKFRGAKLILHSPLDRVVSVENAERIFKAAMHPKSFVSLDDADHLLTKLEHASYAAQVIAAWAERYIPSVAEKADTEGHVIAAESGEGKYHLHVDASGHPLTIDEPIAVGGSDRGPTPYDLLAAALGGCTTLTLRMYADRKKWPVNHIETRVEHAKHHAKDCEECARGHEGRVDVFKRFIHIEGELDKEQRHRMLEIADKCPVHRTLEQSSIIRTLLGQ